MRNARSISRASALAAAALSLSGCALPILLDDAAMEHLRGKTVLMWVGSAEEVQAECAKVGIEGLALRGCTVLQPTNEMARSAAERFTAAGGHVHAVIFSTPNEAVIRSELHRATGLHRGYPQIVF